MRVKRLICVVVTAMAWAGVVRAADVMTLRKGKHEGTFEGYAKGVFVFRTTDGKELREKKIDVRSIVLESPREVQILKTGQKMPTWTKFKKYSALRFTIVEKGRDKALLSTQVKEITVPAAEEDDGGGGGGEAAQAPINIAPLEARDDLTAAQKAALSKYRSARSEYADFLRENKKLVEQMNSARGTTRERLLNKLRMRKNQEQPIKNKYQAAKAALIGQFPELAN